MRPSTTAVTIVIARSRGVGHSDCLVHGFSRPGIGGLAEPLEGGLPGDSAHLTAGTAEEQVQDAAERRDEDDDDLPRSLRQAACMVCLGQAAQAGDLEPDSQADKEQGGNAPATTTSAANSPVIFGPPRP